MAPINGEKKEYKIMCIADLDKQALKTGDDTTWKSLIRRGSLTIENNDKVSISFPEDDKQVLLSSYNYGGRGMELSELLTFNDKLYTVGDKTGIVFEIFNETMIPFVIMPTGDGRQYEGFKGEWMTVKDGLMYIGGHGKELLKRNGNGIKHEHYMWVKTISASGEVKHLNWKSNYNAMRAKSGCSFPGYLTHESGTWSDVHKSWFFLPRKASTEPFNYKEDEKMGTNMLFKCSADFSNIEVIHVGELTDKRKGFSSFKFLPGSNDDIIVAIRSIECDDMQSTYITAFNLAGKTITDDILVSDKNKFEGLEFVK